MTFTNREPVIHATPILELRPTQMTVGMREVAQKRKAWSERDGDALDEFLRNHMVPVVIGPGGGRYIIDHHHLSLALHQEGQKTVFVTVVGDFAKVDRELFWNMMDFHGWTHPFDEKGRRCDYSELPKTIEGMKDDPYRSLSGALRKRGGFAKDSTSYSEFVWADFLRLRVKAKDIKSDFDAALDASMVHAKSTDADYLPGWCAPRGKQGKKKD